MPKLVHIKIPLTPLQTASQGITAIDIAIRISEELADQGWSVLPLRKEYLGCLDDGLGSLDAKVLIVLVIDALDTCNGARLKRSLN